MDNIHESLLIFTIAVSSFLGSYVRIGIGYYKIWKIETNYCILYANLIGSAILGSVSSHKKFLFDSGTSLSKVLYLSLTSGLCGSITTFSSWELECNKNFFLQWDITSSNYFSSYNGGRLIEWAVSLWVGVILPMMAFRLAKDVSAASPWSDVALWESDIRPMSLGPVDKRRVGLNVVVVFFISIICTLLVILIPVLLFPTHIYFTYTAVFGAVGAYLRYTLSKWNSTYPEFPIGTFIVNIGSILLLVGTWILAAVTLLSKLVVPYFDHTAQSVLEGLAVGFCGCLTTMSTFVAEIDRLPTRASYRYGLVSTAVAQIGIIFILNIYSYHVIPKSPSTHTYQRLCINFNQSCANTLEMIGCPVALRKNEGNLCLLHLDDSTYKKTFSGSCVCEHFNATAIIPALTSHEIATKESQLLKQVSWIWPSTLSSDLRNMKIDPTLTFDICLTSQAICDSFLKELDCPQSAWKVSSCKGQGVSHFSPRCSCGDLSVGPALASAVIDVVLRQSAAQKWHSLIPLSASNPSVDYRKRFFNTCSQILSHINCPQKRQTNLIYDSDLQGMFFLSGLCTCGTKVEFGDTVLRFVTTSSGLTDLFPRNTTTSVAIIESSSYSRLCVYYEYLCQSLMAELACPSAAVTMTFCRDTPQDQPFFVRNLGQCRCGTLDLHPTVLDFIVEHITRSSIQTDVSVSYFQDPYLLQTATNPFAQFQ